MLPIATDLLPQDNPAGMHAIPAVSGALAQPAVATPQIWLHYMLDGATLSELVQALAANWQRSLLVVDAAGDPLVQAGPNGPTLITTVALWQHKHPDQPLPPLLAEEHLFCLPLVAAHAAAGTLVIEFHGTSPTDEESRAVNDALVAIELAVQHQQAIQHIEQRANIEQRAHEEFVWDLVSSRMTSTVEAQARGHAEGIDLRMSLRVLVGQIEPDGTHQESLVLATATRATKQLHLAAIGAMAPDQVVLIVASPATDEQMRQIGAQIQSNLGQTDPLPVVSWGVSDPLSGMASLPTQYEEAGAICQIGMMLHGPGKLICAGATGGYRLLYKLAQDPQSRHFWEKYLGALLRAEHRKSGDLIETLERYLATQDNGSETARQLGLHRQTLNYRLQRIEELTGCHLDNEQDRFALDLSVRLYRLECWRTRSANPEGRARFT